MTKKRRNFLIVYLNLANKTPKQQKHYMAKYEKTISLYRAGKL